MDSVTNGSESIQIEATLHQPTSSAVQYRFYESIQITNKYLLCLAAIACTDVCRPTYINPLEKEKCGYLDSVRHTVKSSTRPACMPTATFSWYFSDGQNAIELTSDSGNLSVHCSFTVFIELF